MSDAVRTVGVGIIAAFAALLLREAGFKGAKLLSCVALIAIMGLALGLTGRLVSLIGVGELSENAEWAVRLFIKVVGVGYIFGIGSDICRELGESGVAGALLAVGRVEILLLCMPAFREIFELGMSYLK